MPACVWTTVDKFSQCKRDRGGEPAGGALHRNLRVSLCMCAVCMYVDTYTCVHAQRREEGIGILPEAGSLPKPGA